VVPSGNVTRGAAGACPSSVSVRAILSPARAWFANGAARGASPVGGRTAYETAVAAVAAGAGAVYVAVTAVPGAIVFSADALSYSVAGTDTVYAVPAAAGETVRRAVRAPSIAASALSETTGSAAVTARSPPSEVTAHPEDGG